MVQIKAVFWIQNLILSIIVNKIQKQNVQYKIYK